MRAGVRRVAFVVAVSAAVACSLTDLSGLSESGPVEAPEASAVDSAVTSSSSRTRPPTSYRSRARHPR